MALNFIEAIFPRFCVRCRKEGSLLCLSCRESLVMRAPAPACPFCAREGSSAICKSCQLQVHLDGLIALSAYAEPAMRGLIEQWKYHGDQEAEQLIEALIRRSSRALPFVDAVSFVPLHIGRRRSRGFDQAERLSQMVAKSRNLPACRVLIRHQKTAAQARISQKERLVGDLDEVFSACASIPKRVLLCDDVFTSGATMDAAAKALKAQGAEEVYGFVLAKGNP